MLNFMKDMKRDYLKKVSLNAADFFIREAYNNSEFGTKIFVF